MLGFTFLYIFCLSYGDVLVLINMLLMFNLIQVPAECSQGYCEILSGTCSTVVDWCSGTTHTFVIL